MKFLYGYFKEPFSDVITLDKNKKKVYLYILGSVVQLKQDKICYLPNGLEHFPHKRWVFSRNAATFSSH